MSRSLNKTTLIGNLGQDPEIRYMPNGNPVTNVTIATSESWKDRETGQQQERTEWHRVVFFGKLAEIAGQFLKKGSKVYVEGSNRTRKWQGDDGVDRYTTEVVVDMNGSMLMLDGKAQDAQAPQNNYQQPQQPQRQPAQPRQPAQQPRQQGQQQPQQRSAPQGRQAPQQRTQAPQGYQQPAAAGGGFDDFDDDLPY